MPLYSYEWVMAFVFSYAFFAMGKHDAQDGMAKDNSLLWAALSLGISSLVIKYIDSDWKAVLFFQVMFYISIAAFRAWLETRRKE